jgi:hypothetical protein
MSNTNEPGGARTFFALRTCASDMIPEAYKADRALADAYRDGWQMAARLEEQAKERLDWNAWAAGTAADRDWHRDVWAEVVHEHRKRSSFDETRREIDFHAEGGWFILTRYPEGGKFGPYTTREEAEAEVEDGDRIVKLPSAAALWDAFDAGLADAIVAGLAAYTNADYETHGGDDAAHN